MSIQSTTHAGSRTGVLVLTSPGLEPIYMNNDAKGLCDELGSCERRNTGSSLPSAVRSAVAMVTRRNETSAELLWNGATRPIRLQVFTIERGTQMENPLVIVVLERLDPQRLSHRSPMETSDLFTTREKQVLGWLRKGYTNKEIAFELQISEQTVKKHVSHILLKSRLPNRVGVLARLIGSVA